MSAFAFIAYAPVVALVLVAAAQIPAILRLARGGHSCGPAAHAPREDGLHRSRFFRSHANGLWIFHRTWSAVGQSRGAVYLVHGMGEHCGRYEHVARALSAAGFVVHALDHQGHGQSEGDRGYIDRLENVVSDVLQVRLSRSIRKRSAFRTGIARSSSRVSRRTHQDLDSSLGIPWAAWSRRSRSRG